MSRLWERDIIQGSETKAKKQPHKDPLYRMYDKDYQYEFEERVLTHSHSVSGPKRDIHQKHKIGIRSARRLCFDHYGESDIPHCIECGETDRRVLILHHVNGRKTEPVSWTDIVADGFPEGWLKPLCRNCHARQHDIKFKWEPKVYKGQLNVNYSG